MDYEREMIELIPTKDYYYNFKKRRGCILFLSSINDMDIFELIIDKICLFQ